MIVIDLKIGQRHDVLESDKNVLVNVTMLKLNVVQRTQKIQCHDVDIKRCDIPRG